MKRALIATATIAATISIAACSTSTPGPTTPVASKPASSSTQAAGQATSCAVNPSSAPVPTAEKYDPVSPDARISVSLSGIPSGTIKPGDPPTEVEVTLCNNSPDLFLPLATEALVQGDSSLLETGKRALAGFDRPRPAGRHAFVNRSPNAGAAQWLRSHVDDMDANERLRLPQQTLYLSPGGAAADLSR